jgi:hypothetical protein
MGGLGNQLFQIFTTISISLTNKIPFIFRYSDNIGNRNAYWNTFLVNLKKFTSTNITGQFIVYKEPHFHYLDIPINIEQIEQNILLSGYFQSYKYFEKSYNQICRLIRLEENKKKIINKYNYPYSKSISMHFRLGDYKYLQDFHNLLTIDYYTNSLQYMEKKLSKSEIYYVLYFCENKDNDIVLIHINKLNKLFPQFHFMKVSDEIEDWEQMLIMSCCNHNIIANSTFSWWGAYFNVDPNKIVCYPSNWFGPKLKDHILNDLFPKEWVQI